MFIIKLLRFLKKSKCNHIVGIEHSHFGHKEVIYENEYIKNKCRFYGEILWICPICRKKIWAWVERYKSGFGHYQAREYIGYKI